MGAAKGILTDSACQASLVPISIAPVDSGLPPIRNQITILGIVSCLPHSR